MANPILGAYLSLDDASEPNPTYVDISNLARSFRVDAGRSNELEDFDTAHARLVVDDPNGDFVPWNKRSRFWPYILPNRRLRLAQDGVQKFEGYVNTFTPGSKRWGDATCTIEASDLFKLLQHERLTA